MRILARAHYKITQCLMMLLAAATTLEAGQRGETLCP